MPKLVSVIVPTFNQERFIGRCLRSLLHQTLPHSQYEIIVIDDGSRDLTPYALSQFSEPGENLIRVLTNERNLGLPAALNKGINASTSKYILRVDSDDYVNVNLLLILSSYLEANRDSDAVACDYIVVSDDESVKIRYCAVQSPIACGILFKREHLLDIGLYDEKFLVHEDRDLRIRYEKRYTIDHLKMPLYRYRRHQNNITNDKQNMDSHEVLLNQKHHLMP